MFTFYADDSGTSPDQPVAIATALIVPNAQIPRLENEWTTLKEKEGFSFFHTSEFVHRNPKSEFADWAKEKQERVLRRVRQISKKYGLVSFSCAVNKKDYNEVVPNEMKRLTGKHHYTWCLPDRLQGEDEEEMKRIASISHDDVMVRKMRKHPQFAADYLRAALEESDEPRVLLLALRHVAQARGIASIAKAAGIERESLYRALSANGNPRLSTLYAVAKAVGLKLTIEAA